MSDSAIDLVQRLLREARTRGPLRAGALLVTLFGDLLMPRTGSIATQSLLDLTNLFGLSDGVMRTALSRLSAEGMFERSRMGRRSFYRLTESAWDEFEKAAEIIYADPSVPNWTLDWLVVFDMGIDGGRIADDIGLRKELQALGFAKIGPRTYLRPATADQNLRKSVDLILDDQPVLLIDGRSAPIPTGFKSSVEALWDLDDLSRGYQRFVRQFRAVSQAISKGKKLDDRSALILRILAIHSYRLLVLKDPHLPLEILPPDWSGDLAQILCRDIYVSVFDASERWIDQHCMSEDGPLPPNDGRLIDLFSGVVKDA